MRTTTLRFGSILTAMIVSTSACGSDSGTEAQSQFTDFEVNQLLNAVAAPVENIDIAAGVAAAVEPVNSTVNCQVSGTATIAGTRDPGPAVDFDARVTYTNCATASLTLNGVIDVTATSSVPSTGVLNVTWTFLGTVTSKKDGQTRSCTMDVTRVRTTTNGATTTTASGNICNRTAS